MQPAKCPACEGIRLNVIFEHPRIPAYNVNYYPTREGAKKAPSVPVRYCQCLDCNFVFNSVYEQLSYQVEYNVSRKSSLVYNEYLSEVCDFVIESFQGTPVRRVIEIGAGDCSFAELLAERLVNIDRYYAFDPSWFASGEDKIITRISDYYVGDIGNPDLVVARHVLEHQQDVRAFTELMATETPAFLFIEIPCREFVLEDNFHCFANEHCSYLGQDTLDFLMKDIGYQRLAAKRVFNSEYIIAIYAHSERTPIKLDIADARSEIHEQNGMLSTSFLEWKNNLREKIDPGDLIWGANGKGVMMVNILDLDDLHIPFVCDKNKEIGGKFIPVMGNQIISPSDVKNFEIGKIIVLNKLYLEEIRDEVRQMGMNNPVKFIGDL